jgi:capsular polysaccharide biosynthesis protein
VFERAMWATWVLVAVAVALTVAGLWQTPTYEASAQVRVVRQQGDRQIIPLPAPGQLQTLAQMVAMATDARPVAEEAIGRLGLRTDPAELLDNLTVEQVESTNLVRLTYEGTDPYEAKRIVDTVGEVASESFSGRSAAGGDFTATLVRRASVPDAPVSPNPLRNGLLVLVVGLVLIWGAAGAIETAKTRRPA